MCGEASMHPVLTSFCCIGLQETAALQHQPPQGKVHFGGCMHVSLDIKGGREVTNVPYLAATANLGPAHDVFKRFSNPADELAHS